MIDSVFAYLAGLLCLGGYLFYARKKKISKKRVMLCSVFILYMTGVISLTLFPLVYDRAYSSPSDILENRLHLIPFEVIVGMITRGILQYSLLQICGNLIMTIPFGFAVIPLLSPKLKKHSRLFFIILAFAFPVWIELSQLAIGLLFGILYRTCDIDDVILNSTGIFIGYGLYFLFLKIRRKIKK